MKHEKSFDIARSIRAIEGLKVDLLGAVTGLFRSLQGGPDSDALAETLSQVIFYTWRLAGRLGVPMELVNARLSGKVESLRVGEPDAAAVELAGISRG
ncbi:MAG: hypothetical protein GX549_01905 [Clostridiales bacterium]|nr:hypothetical protein [Clostridiales bacterium]